MAEAATKLPVTKSTTPVKAEDRAPFESLRQEIDRLFDEFRPFDWRLPSRMLGLEVPRIVRAEWQLAPAMDLGRPMVLLGCIAASIMGAAVLMMFLL